MTGDSSGITVNRLSFAYVGKPALSNASLKVRSGKFTALLGPNGAGKSTLLALLTGLLAAREGTISINGFDSRTQLQQALAQTGIVFQQSALDLDLTVEQNMIYGAGLRGYWGGTARRNINNALERMDLANRAHHRARELNGGHRRRLEVARALVHQPKVLILDEPTVGLDIPTRHELVEHVHQLTTDSGITVLWATHLVDEIHSSDDLILLHQGQVRLNGPVKALLEQHAHPTVLSLFQSVTAADSSQDY